MKCTICLPCLAVATVAEDILYDAGWYHFAAFVDNLTLAR